MKAAPMSPEPSLPTPPLPAASLLDLAEAPAAYAPLAEGEALVVFDEYTLSFGTGPQATANCVQRLRIDPDDLESAIARARQLARRRGCAALTWEVCTAADPAGLTARLLALGLRAAQPPRAELMALTHRPPVEAHPVTVERVDTLAAFKDHVAVTHRTFDAMDRLPAEWARIDRCGAQVLAQRSFVRYNALVDGQVVGAATATFAASGVMLHSGSVLPAFRHRGVYSALVLQRWHDAAARDTPALVTRAGPMSQPILARLGFERIGGIDFLVDTL